MAKIYDNGPAWTLTKREIRQVIFTQHPTSGELSAEAIHQYQYTNNLGDRKWEGSVNVTATQAELLSVHPKAIEVLEAIKTLFHDKANLVDNT